MNNQMTKKEELVDIRRQLKGFENLQSWMLESDEKEELRDLKQREQELIKA
jgi:hypothetical protein